MALGYGLLASLATVGATALMLPGLFTSVAGLIVVAVLAHASGTAVATLVASHLRQEVVAAFAVLAVATLCALLMLVTTAGTFATLVHVAPRTFDSAAGVIACCSVGYLAASYVGGRMWPSWNKQAVPIALAVLALATLCTSIVGLLGV